MREKIVEWERREGFTHGSFHEWWGACAGAGGQVVDDAWQDAPSDYLLLIKTGPDAMAFGFERAGKTMLGRAECDNNIFWGWMEF